MGSVSHRFGALRARNPHLNSTTLGAIEALVRAARGVIVPVLVYMLPFSPVVQAQSPDVRQLDFPATGSPEALKAFLRGVVWLHSFEYEEALKAFQEAGRIEANFAMAYWGGAMAYNDPIWHEGGSRRGTESTSASWA